MVDPKMYLHGADGNPVSFSDDIANLYKEDSKKILILGDGYPSNKKEQYMRDVRTIIKKIFSVSPFSILVKNSSDNTFLEKLMIFSSYTSSKNWGPSIISSNISECPVTDSTHSTAFGIKCDLVDRYIGPSLDLTSKECDTSTIVQYIKTIQEFKFKDIILKPIDIWLTPPQNNNPAQVGSGWQLIVVISPYTPPTVKINLGMVWNSLHSPTFWNNLPSNLPINYLETHLPSAYLSLNHNIENWPNVVIHELGHSFGLQDEYEYSKNEFPDPKNSLIQCPNENIIFRSELLNNPIFKDDENSDLTPDDIDIMNLFPRWIYLMTEDDIKELNKEHFGFFTYRDFWKVNDAGLINRDVNGFPIKSDIFPCNKTSECSESAKYTEKDENFPFFWRFARVRDYKRRIFLVEGGFRVQRNVFRSSLECIMRLPMPFLHDYSESIFFCFVCEDILKEKLGIKKG